MRFTTTSGFQEAASQICSWGPSQPVAAEDLVFGFAARRRQSPALASLTVARSKVPGRNLLASLTGLAGLGFLGSRDAGLRKTFNSIDVDGKGHITEKDLEAFARRSGLPVLYATSFVTAALAGAAGEGHSGDAELTFALFRRFVRSREEALRRAFSLFDQDGDGRISVADLDASLARVAVCCPRTRCIYRCRAGISSSRAVRCTSGSGGGSSCVEGAGAGGAITARSLHSAAAAEHGYLGFSEFRDFFLLLPAQDMLVEYWVAAGTVPDLSDKVQAAKGEAAARGSPWGHLLAGAIAGATSRTATAPLEVLRLTAMAGQLRSRSLAQAASDIVTSQGWRGLYRGNLLNVLRSAPQKALDFFAFDAFKRLLGDDTAAKTFLAAGLAGCTSWVALYPLEVVRSRITVAAAAAASPTCAATAAATAATAASRGGGGPALGAAIAAIVRTEGAGALYRGLGPSVAAIFPEAAITYGMHDALKKLYTRVVREEPGVAPSLAAGVFSAFLGQLVSFPLETVSRRLQVAGVGAAAGGAGAAAGGSGLGAVAAVVRGLLAEGGPAALYRGIGAATLRLVPMAVVSFGTYEVVRSLVVAWEAKRDEEGVREMLHSRCVPLVLEGPNGGHAVVGRICTPVAGPGPAAGPGAALAPALCGSAAAAITPPCCAVGSCEGVGGAQGQPQGAAVLGGEFAAPSCGAGAASAPAAAQPVAGSCCPVAGVSGAATGAPAASPCLPCSLGLASGTCGGGGGGACAGGAPLPGAAGAAGSQPCAATACMHARSPGGRGARTA